MGALRLEVGDRREEVVEDVHGGESRQLVHTGRVGHLVVATVKHLRIYKVLQTGFNYDHTDLEVRSELKGVAELFETVALEPEPRERSPLS